jgi:hypothetical protein
MLKPRTPYKPQGRPISPPRGQSTVQRAADVLTAFLRKRGVIGEHPGNVRVWPPAVHGDLIVIYLDRTELGRGRRAESRTSEIWLSERDCQEHETVISRIKQANRELCEELQNFLSFCPFCPDDTGREVETIEKQ